MRREARLMQEQIIFLRKLSRKTWAFFETFVGAEDHWLPPDNYQEYRGAAVAHRTSPTNIGMALLANLSAYDFGYIPAGKLIERTANTLRTLEGLERYRGHFYNWYDTLSLQPLHPKYVSTVDSGNLAGHLLTLRPGLLALADDPILAPRLFDGLHDTLGILVDVAANAAPPALAQLQTDFATACASRPSTLAQAWQCLDRLTRRTAAFAESLDAAPRMSQTSQTGGEWRRDGEENAIAAENPIQLIPHANGVYVAVDEPSIHHPTLDHASPVLSETASEIDLNWWARKLARQCRVALDELTFLAPWLSLPATPSGLVDYPGFSAIPTLRALAGIDDASLPGIECQPGEVGHESLQAFRRCMTDARQRATERIAMIERLAQQASEFACMEYGFLYDKASRLLAIGYNVDELRRDASYYDLLASEARLINFVAIAQGQVPQESWFALGRLLTSAGGEPILLSWSGSMFEYLMPLLVMPTFDDTLLDQTYRAAVERQIEYGRQRGVPWGMSESGYHLVDIHLNYQYRAFGVPGLGT